MKTIITDDYFNLDPSYNYYTTHSIIQKMRLKLIELGHPMITGKRTDYKLLTEFTELRFQFPEKTIEKLFEETFKIRSEFLDFKILFNDNDWYFEPAICNKRYRDYIIGRINNILKHFNCSITDDKKYYPIIEQFITMAQIQNINSMNKKLILKNSGCENLFEFFVKQIKKNCCDDKSNLYYQTNKDILDKILKTMVHLS